MFSTLESAIVSTVLTPAAAQQFAKGRIAKQHLTPLITVIHNLSESYLTDRGSAPSIDPQKAAAYSLYFLPINFSKIDFLLRFISHRTDSIINILDYGCGPGTASFACLNKLSPNIQVCAYDQSQAMLTVAKKILQSWKPDVTQKIIFTDEQTQALSAKYDLIIAANVFNEISSEQVRWNTLMKLRASLKPGGEILVLEPALKTCADNLVTLRDRVAHEAKELRIIFPCTHHNPCPLKQRENLAWCHGTLHWKAWSIVNQIDEILGYNKHRLKYAALLLKNQGQTPNGYRVLRASSKSKTGTTATICGENFFGAAILRKRYNNPNNVAFQKLQSFERVAIDEIQSDGQISGAVKLLQ